MSAGNWHAPYSRWVLCLVFSLACPAVWAQEPAADDAAAPADRKSDATTISSEAEIVEFINKMIRQGWTDAGIGPSKAATDGEWVRRVYLDVLGRTPTADEVQKFLNLKSKNKKSDLLKQLLTSDEYIEDYARNFTTLWTNILIGRTGGTDQDDIISREGMQQYIRRSFLENRPFDDFTYRLVSADGVNKPGEEEYNGAVNFIMDNLDENAATATAKTARIFLGLQVQCTQCHNHPFNDWKQDQFWSLNAFFRQTQTQRLDQGRDMPTMRLYDVDFAGEPGAPSIEEAAIFYEQRNGVMKSALPRFVDGTAIDSHGSLTKVNRRDELARLIRESPYFPKAIVNRMWGHFLGYGFTKPVDDMGPHNPPSHPELLDRLGQEFASHGFDVQQLIRWIALSDAYGLSSRVIKKNAKDDPTLGERPMFSHFYLRQMTAEQLYESLVTATAADETRGTYEEQEARKNMWLQQFSLAFGTDENDESTTFNGTIPQTLMMMNGELVVRATSGETGTFLQKVAASPGKPQDKIKTLYMAALARTPTKPELDSAYAAYNARKSDEYDNDNPGLGALQDIWWVLLNSNEFILNH